MTQQRIEPLGMGVRFSRTEHFIRHKFTYSIFIVPIHHTHMYARTQQQNKQTTTNPTPKQTTPKLKQKTNIGKQESNNRNSQRMYSCMGYSTSVLHFTEKYKNNSRDKKMYQILTISF